MDQRKTNPPALKIAHVSVVDLGIVFLWPQLRALQADGFEVHAICASGPWVSMLEAQGIKVYPIKIRRKISPFADFRLLWKLVFIMRRERYTIVHTHTAKLEVIGQLAARLARVPIVLYTNHGFIFRGQMSTLKRHFLISLAHLAGRLSDHTLSQSSEDISTALELGVYRAERLSYLGNGIDLARFDRRRFTPEQIRLKRREVGLPSDHRVVGMVGRYVREKGYREFFEAAGFIVRENPAVSFLTVGVSLTSERDPVDFAVLKQLGLQERVIVLESREDMPDLYALMDVVVLPSHREGFPRSLMEAAAMAKPIIATDIAGCRQAVVDGHNGFLVPVKDKQALAEKIQRLLDDEALASRLGRNGRALAEEHFDEAKVIERLRACYRTLLSKKLSISVPETPPVESRAADLH